MSGMEQLYQQLILDHARERHGEGLAEDYAAESFQVNPTCGDQVRLRVATDGAVVQDVTWEGHGCSISQASISVMHDLVKGQPMAEVDRVAEAFRDMMHSQGAELSADAEDTLQDAIAFEGVAKYPARVKCALLGWMALRDALARAIAQGGEDD